MRRVPHAGSSQGSRIEMPERAASDSIQLRESVRHEGMYTKLHEHSLPSPYPDKMVEKKEEDEW